MFMPISPGRQPIEPDTPNPKDPIHRPHKPDHPFHDEHEEEGIETDDDEDIRSDSCMQSQEPTERDSRRTDFESRHVGRSGF
jgi:hypothetical protein